MGPLAGIPEKCSSGCALAAHNHVHPLKAKTTGGVVETGLVKFQTAWWLA